MGNGRIFLKISAPLSLINTYKMNLISATTIPLDSTIKGDNLDKGAKYLLREFLAVAFNFLLCCLYSCITFSES